VFTIEYAARVWCSVERDDGRYRHPVRGRLRYVLSPLALIDLLAILPFYLTQLLPVDLRFMRVFRLLVIFKLTRYHSSMILLGRVLRSEAGPISAALFILVTLLIAASSFVYLAERDAQPEVFASVPDAMWWAIVTMTTVGYGDMVPVTPLGKFVGGVIAIIGVGMVALPAGMLASGFSEQLHQRRREFESEVNRVLRDGVISTAEGARLREIRDRLGLPDEAAPATPGKSPEGGPMTLAWAWCGVLAVSVVAVAQDQRPVTVENFFRAESDIYLGNFDRPCSPSGRPRASRRHCARRA
jgi:voltage-gated potassium channel